MEGELAAAVDAIIKARWELRDGEVVPETKDITLGNSGVKLEATVLYADLADSTELALFDREIAAEVYKAYLVGTTQLIKAAGGEIRSFDGDRVMGVFIGNYKTPARRRPHSGSTISLRRCCNHPSRTFIKACKDPPFGLHSPSASIPAKSG